MKKKTILIIGATGFIGYHLAKKCIEKKWKVESISSQKPPKKRHLKNIKYFICDISDKDKLKNTIKKNYNYVVNLGGYIDHSDRKKTYLTHYIGCRNLSEIFLRKDISAFIQIGSSAEYGTIKSPQKENSKCHPTSIYGKSKLFSTLHLMKLFRENKFPCTVLRLYQVYGPRQDYNRFIPIVIKSCLKNIKFPCSMGNQFRDFIHVNDVVNVIMKSIINKNCKGKIINVGTGKVKKLKNIINVIKNKIKGGKPQYGIIKLRKDEIINVSPDLKCSKKILNWKPKVTFNQGLNNTIRYIKKNLN